MRRFESHWATRMFVTVNGTNITYRFTTSTRRFVRLILVGP
jgi:hypothetical protein